MSYQPVLTTNTLNMHEALVSTIGTYVLELGFPQVLRVLFALMLQPLQELSSHLS